ncbi:MAG: aminomethyl-transferring glycine dehydrogenase subunit GcvPB [Spirochaetaceae bacterium]|jgi:glycine dehydrogenase subunit 2|nr:aminomethyl-transferring glycine dehydrogenase subunit GcvPB [Spirochaetaceae bacterium]
MSNLWKISGEGRSAVYLPALDVPETAIPASIKRAVEPNLPEVAELDLVRHYTNLSRKNFSIDTHFYPLGSCTMKYNPKVNEVVAALPGFRNAHPYQGDDLSQGANELLYNMQNLLTAVSGFEATSLQPAAGAQGELTGILMIRKYHEEKGELEVRRKILIPDSAHGTNPATAAMSGFDAIEIPSDSHGNIDLEALKSACDETIAGIMITNPNTLGLFEENILEVIKAVHDCGGLVYGDGANFNAIMGIVKPGDLGFDVMHYNVHKTFTGPHGGGGPGAGPVSAGALLKDYLPGPVAVKEENVFHLRQPVKTIGRMKLFYGNFGILVRGYTYISMLGAAGLKEVTEMAVLNANYLKALISHKYPIAYDRGCMHEFVCRGDLAPGIHTLDIAKRLIDYGFHPPTIYFPLIVPEAIMIEPTETESRETIEAFAEAMISIADEAQNAPELLHNAPMSTKLKRLDEAGAVKNPVLRY